MELQKVWKKYRPETRFNFSALPRNVQKQGECLKYQPKQMIVSRGSFPEYVYFILEGTAVGIREYSDGSEYSYFQLDATNGSIGLLEIMAQKEQYIATIVSLSETVVIRMESAYVYEVIQSDLSILRKCTHLLAEDLYKRSGNDGLLYYLSGIDRIRFYLVNYYEEHQKSAESAKVIVEAAYQDIASRVGISTRTVGRNLQKLKENKEIGSSRKKIVMTQTQYQNMREKIYSFSIQEKTKE